MVPGCQDEDKPRHKERIRKSRDELLQSSGHDARNFIVFCLKSGKCIVGPVVVVPLSHLALTGS
jgi:hypothetical protein